MTRKSYRNILCLYIGALGGIKLIFKNNFLSYIRYKYNDALYTYINIASYTDSNFQLLKQNIL